MSKFNKIKNFGSSATVVSYAYFQAFKFPDSMNVHFQCVIQVCRYNCPDPVCPDDGSTGSIPDATSPAFPPPGGGISPTFSGQPFVQSAGAPFGADASQNTFVVNPRAPATLPAVAPPQANRRRFRPGTNRFSARQGRDQGIAARNEFSVSDAGASSQHQNNMNNYYYANYQNHRVKRHEENMKKSSVGIVNTNSSLQVNYIYIYL
jgi:hypothetical protein